MAQDRVLVLTASELAALKNAIWLRPRLMQHLDVVRTIDDAHFSLDVDATCIKEYLEDTAAEFTRLCGNGQQDDGPILRALIDKLAAL